MHERLAWCLDDFRTRVIYFFRPPDQAVFQPEISQQVAMGCHRPRNDASLRDGASRVLDAYAVAFSQPAAAKASQQHRSMMAEGAYPFTGP